MAEIVNSLFGLSPMQVRQQQDLENQAFGSQIAQTYFDPTDRENAYRGAMVGNAIAKLGGSLFGLQTPELKRATELESILQQTIQEVGSQDPAQLYPVLANRLGAAGYGREAMQVGQIGQKAIQESGVSQAQQRKFVAEASAKEQETAREEQLRTALSKLSPNATDEQYLAVVRQFAPAKDVMSSIEKSQVAEENRKAKLEEIKAKATEQRQQLEMRLSDAKLAREDRAALQQQLANQANATRLQIAELSKSSKGLNLTPAQKRADAVFGQDYSNYVALGGKSVIDKQLSELDDVINMIEKDKANVSGKDISAAAALGDTALAAYSPKALEARDKIGGVVQSNLRAILGGQFAQKEGEALLARAYNLAADPKDNLKRLKSLREQIANTAKAKESAINYYEDTGTLTGFKPNQKEDPLGIR